MASHAPSTDRTEAGQRVALARTSRRVLAVLACVLALAAPAPLAHAQSGQPSLCHPERSTRTEVAPSRIRRAEKALVSTFLSFSCPAPIEPVHSMLVTDAELVAADRAVRDGLADLSARLVITSNHYARIGRIDFGKGARTMCGVINDPAEVALCLSGAGVDDPDPALHDPAPTLAHTIDQARKRLVAARDDDPPSPDNPMRAPRDILVIVAGWPTVHGGAAGQAALCAAVQPQVTEAAAAGIDVRLACADEACAQSCLVTAMAEATGRVDAVGSWREAVDDLVGRAWATEARVARLDVRERLNRIVRIVDDTGQQSEHRIWSVVPGSVEPPIPLHRETSLLQWTLTQPMSKTVELTYHLLPQMEHGTFALRQSGEFGAVAIVHDTRGGYGLYRLNNPTIVVAGWGPFVAFMPMLERTFLYEHSY